MNWRVSQLNGIENDTILGSSPPIDAISLTTSVSKFKPITRQLVETIATREEGNWVVSLGKK